MGKKRNRKKHRKNIRLYHTVAPDFSFKVIDGSEIRNLFQLAEQLGNMSDDAFHYHVNEDANHFSNWVLDVFNETRLAKDLSVQKTRPDAQISVLKFLVNQLK